MSVPDVSKHGKRALPSLKDADIVTSRNTRRAFLTIVGIGSASLLSSLFMSGCSKADKCDADRQTDIDVRDPINRKKDRCDTDGT